MITTVTDAHEDDVPQLVGVHATAFPGHFLTKLGPTVVAALYLSMLKSGRCIVLMARDSATGRVMGLAAGSTDGGGLRGVLLRSPRFVFAVALVVMRRPQLFASVVGRQRRFRRADSVTGSAALWSIAVDSGFARRGVGTLLLKEFESRCAKHGATEVRLTTNADDNDRTISFYQGHGYQVLFHHQEGERRLLVFHRRLVSGKSD